MPAKPERGSRCRWHRVSIVAAFAVSFVALPILNPLGFSARAQEAGASAPFARPGYPLGQFRVFPSVAFENTYNDNIFSSEDGEVDDYFASIVPRLSLESNWSRHLLSARAVGRISRYATVTTEDNEEYEVEARGRFDVAEGSSLGAIFGQGRRTVGRTDSENSGRLDPQQLDYFEGELRYDREFARFALDLRGFVNHLDFLDSRDTDRDRIHFGGSARLSHRFSPAFSVFVEPSLKARDYSQTVDNAGVERSSATLVGFAGSTFDISSILEGEIALSIEHTRFDETTFDDLTIVGVRGAARWKVTTLTQLEVEMERSGLPTSVDGASSKTRTQVQLEVRHELLRNVLLRANATYFREEFDGLGRTDDNYRARIGAEYLINRFFSLTARYDYRVRDSDISSKEFRRNIVMLTLEARL